MLDFPLDFPTGIRPLVLYDIHQWKTAEKSYKNYEKLCEITKNETISYDDYDYLYNKYLKETYFSAGIRSKIQITDIRLCILSDVIDKKSAEISYNEMKYVFGIGKIHHDYWFKYYNNIMHPLTFSELPLDVVAKIVKKCDLKSYLCLRKVSHTLRIIADQQRPPYEKIEIVMGERGTIVHLNEAYLKYWNGNYFYCGNWMKTKKYQDFAKFVFGEVEMPLGNPKLQLKFLDIRKETEKKPNKKPKLFKQFFASLNHKIHVEHLSLTRFSEEDEKIIFNSMKPGVLKTLILHGKHTNFDHLVTMDQWKKAKNVTIKTESISTKIEHFFQFNSFTISIRRISIDNLKKLIEAASKSPNFKFCKIQAREYQNMEEIKRALNLQQRLAPNTYSIPDSDLIFEFERWACEGFTISKI